MERTMKICSATFFHLRKALQDLIYLAKQNSFVTFESNNKKSIIKFLRNEIPTRIFSHQPKMIAWVLASPIFDSL